MKLAIVTAYTPDYKSRADIAIESAKAVPDVEVISEVVRAPVHKEKFRIMRELLPSFDSVMWMDADCVVTAPSQMPIGYKDVCCAQDWNGLCSCVFMVRRSGWAEAFLDACYFGSGIRETGTQHDQATLKHFYYNVPSVAWRMGLWPTCIVADQTITPWPQPFIWHLSMGASTEGMMREALSAVKENRFEAYAKAWPGMPHGVRYE